MPYLTIHGHFYQPPRENPWTEEIDREPTADPFHDWNERISEEAYRPNAFARILSDDGRVVDILNNFAYLSFNFGPTVLSWLRVYAPDVYQRIREGDALSLARLGHGNAIAQGYNHVIMPLANRRDKITQVRWGLADFRYHFGREAEALWLPETAADTDTLEVLAAHGMKYVVLAPGQAARVRPLGSDQWIDVSDGGVDPRRAYWCRLPSGRRIAAFFYDGQAARDMSFGDLLSTARGLVQRLSAAAAGASTPGEPLIHTATDGETFGHHKKFAELTLIYAFTHAAPSAGFTITNYSAVLDVAPPQWEAQIKDNSSWSCAHGVERWRSACGCSTGGQADWHQRWRGPLRAALDELRDSLAGIFEREAPAVLGEAWAARDAYGDVLPDRTPERTQAWLDERAGRHLTERERTDALTLLEMQRQAMLMYTSCGWFFNDVAGLETAQVLKYAAYAIDLAARFTDEPLTDRLLKALELAPGNTAEHPTGADVYRDLVLPAAIRPGRIAASYAINALVKPFPVRHHRHAHRLEQTESLLRQIGGHRLNCGHLYVTSDFTGERTGWTYAAFHFGGYNFAASVLRCDDESLCQTTCAAIKDDARDADGIPELIRALQTAVSGEIISLADLPPADRRRVLKHIEEELLADLGRSYQHIYTEHLGTIAALHAARLRVPPELRLAAEYTLSHRLERALADLAAHAEPAAEAEAAKVLETAARDGLRLEIQPAVRLAEQAVVNQVEELVRTNEEAARLKRYQQLNSLITALRRLGFDVCPARAQEILLEFLRANQARDGLANGQSVPLSEAAHQLADLLRLSRDAVSYAPARRPSAAMPA